MGWRSVLRDLENASRRAAREEDRRKRAVVSEAQRQLKGLDREAAQLEADEGRILDRVAKLEARLTDDPVRPLKASFIPGEGWTAEPVEISTKSSTARLELISGDVRDGDTWFEPDHQVEGDFCIRPLSVIGMKYGTLLALELTSQTTTRVSWVKKSEPASGNIALLDPESSTYYYATSGDLNGQLIAGHSRVAVVGFEPFRSGCRSLELHILDVKLQPGRAPRHSLQFRAEGPGVLKASESALAARSLREEAQEVLTAKATERYRELEAEAKRIETRAKRQAGGCLVLLAVGASFMAATLLS